MSPEQIRREPLDGRTDLFSFGLVLFEMASGQRAFTGDSVAQVHERIVHETQPPLQRLNSKAPARLGAIIAKALEKDRERRYQSATQIAEDLNALEPGKVQPLSRGLKIAAAVMLSIAALVVAFFYWRARSVAPTF
jgi:serine/threonine protein kinase